MSQSIWSVWNDAWLKYQPFENGRRYAIKEKDGWCGGTHVHEIFEQIDAIELYE